MSAEIAGELLPSGMNQHVGGSELELPLEAVPFDETVSGKPLQAFVPLGTIGDVETGIWELRGGTVTDTEVDEIFVVIEGSAIIDFVDEDRRMEVGVGDVVRLVAGSRTRWNVQDRIRKVYITPA
ncbi:cupin domain-containing protein [Leucobacter sp. CSA2]|uniref:Cupin domain-containing protein n=1 Tax=Leucobacter edaphi TaxID=2796472 RepID=A0A934UX29_9MICO|nr:cupin domain-containing protein [Leucobacter edaphi]MBK0420512.1 cupin domain-containing protein [Leucobacter edaphi]